MGKVFRDGKYLLHRNGSYHLSYDWRKGLFLCKRSEITSKNKRNTVELPRKYLHKVEEIHASGGEKREKSLGRHFHGYLIIYIFLTCMIANFTSMNKQILLSYLTLFVILSRCFQFQDRMRLKVLYRKSNMNMKFKVNCKASSFFLIPSQWIVQGLPVCHKGLPIQRHIIMYIEPIFVLAYAIWCCIDFWSYRPVYAFIQIIRCNSC